MPEFRLPDLGEGLEEATILNWLVAPGDTVAVDQPVVEVETAKAAVEVPVPFDGVVERLHGEAGTAVKVGAPLITVGAASGDATAAAGRFDEPGVETSGAVLIGYGTTADGPRTYRSRRARAAAVAANGAAAAPATAVPTGPVPVISPVVRKLAHDRGIDLRSIHGSGPSGLILRRDVEAALATPAAPAEKMTGPVEKIVAREDLTRIPLTGLRKTVADKLSRSRREIPEATVWVDVDATAFLAARKQLNAAQPHHPVSLVGLLARFTVLALKKYPELNGRVEGEEILVPAHVNVGFAAQTDRGLVVPVIKNADSLSTRDLSAAMTRLTQDARDGKLKPDDMTGGTITVNNYGVFGVDGSAAIINHPESAIIGMGRIIDRPWVVDGQLTVRKVSQLTLAFDHRVCDGGTAGGLLRYLADCVEAPIVALGDL